MNTKKIFLTLATIIAVIGCGNAYSRNHATYRSHGDFSQSNDLDSVLDNIEAGHDLLYDAEEGSHTEGEQAGCSAASKRNTDEYIDKVLEEVKPKLPEPAFLPERVGRLKLFNGTLENLSNLQRTGPALVRCTDSTFSFLVPIGFRNLTGRYYWEMDTGLPVFRGLFDMFIGKVDADVLYTRQRKPDESGNRGAVIEKFQINKLEGVKINFDGLGPMNRVVSRFTNLVARFFSRGVSRVLEGPVRNAINKELKQVEKYERFY
ncbi:uncharacterized protein NPIL_30231 [Nephila pilipes]|uniref:Takeout n=1 Tax=Nephila pilipes TaxID=299642 RepID=A0A8X6QMV7_NEPPI|nr:uncharacterized protein NPIL_30231 [Nephila pilipes]